MTWNRLLNAAPRRPASRRMSARARALRWAIPLAVVPVLWLLAYGFKTDPRHHPSPLVGKPASPFTLTTFDGRPISLPQQSGRVVVVNF